MTALATGPDRRLDEFRRMISAYQQATERLKESHDLLLSEVARLRAELVAKDQQLERRQRLAALGEMAAGVAHEIRNPLGSIQLYADLLVRGLAGDAGGPRSILAGGKGAELAGKIGTAVRGLDAIVSDMLTFTRIIEADRRPTPLAALVAEAAGEAARLDAAGVTLDVTGLDPALTVELDGRLFKRVLVNLMINAADAMAGPTCSEKRLAISAEPMTDSDSPFRWRITVADTGPGIPAEVIEKIFHPFFTTKDHGTGLGLAIVHHIVEAHGGVISAANRPEGGAVFTVSLP
jgi:signal transduction histidine kinase